ncbi:PHKG1 (predicted) [Pycnogonum litorale]
MAKDEDELPDQDAARDFYAKYEPKEVLGKGVSSTVRRCVEKETGQEFAAKIIDISPDAEDPQAVRDATYTEINILRCVAGHQFIIDLHDVYESETFIFLIFEICRNGELFDYLTTVVTLSEKRTKVIMKQLFDVVSHIHSKNIVHRDLKPENILLDDNYNIKLTDFGFAKVLRDGEKLTDLCGTPGYLAPELLKASMYEDTDGYSIEVDMWACGVIMYTLLVGCPPFWHRRQMIMLRNIMDGKFKFHSPEWDNITDTPKDLISKLLIVDPEKRLTVSEALKHEFFQSHGPTILTDRSRTFNAKKTLKFGMLCIRCLVRLKRLRFTPEPLSVEQAKIEPYKIKPLRKVIDACAFRVYGHWVKRGEEQNRAALFENRAKNELRNRIIQIL